MFFPAQKLSVVLFFYLVKENDIQTESAMPPVLYTPRPIWLQIFCTLAIINEYVSKIWLFIYTAIAWNLSGFTSVLFSSNQPTANLLSLFKIFISSLLLFPATDMVLPSAKFCKSVSIRQRNKSFTNILHRIETSIYRSLWYPW